jgi:hypothetical protein
MFGLSDLNMIKNRALRATRSELVLPARYWQKETLPDSAILSRVLRYYQAADINPVGEEIRCPVVYIVTPTITLVK